MVYLIAVAGVIALASIVASAVIFILGRRDSHQAPQPTPMIISPQPNNRGNSAH